MFEKKDLSEIKTELQTAQSVAILLPPDPSPDQTSAAISLCFALEGAGKTVQIASGSPLKVGNSEFFGVNKVKTSIGNQNLVITFDFKEENLKKVDYDLDENGKFQLLIQPQPGTPPPDTSTIEYSYQGASADLVFVFGISSLEELGKVYAEEKSFLDKAKVVSINQLNKPLTFALASLHVHAATCVSEIVASLIKELGYSPTPDGATNLLKMISELTSQFSSPRVSADTFEIVAYLMRQGGTMGRTNLAVNSRFGAFPPPTFGSFTPPMFGDEESEDPPFVPKNTPQRRGAPLDWKRPKIMRPQGDISKT